MDHFIGQTFLSDDICSMFIECRSSDTISSSTPVDTELYRYSASTSHAWTTVSTRSSVASVRTPGPVFVPSDHRDDDDDDSDSESDSGDANGKIRILSSV